MFFMMILMFLFFSSMMLIDNSVMVNLKLDSLYYEFTINFNYMNSLFSLVVLMISSGVILYSKAYFHNMMMKKYSFNLFIFIMSMILLINSGNVFSMIVGWDGLGISSYFLVSYYSEEVSMFCGMITFFMNRLGDAFIMIFISMLIYSPNILFVNFMGLKELTIMLLGLLTKSAQLPFGVWLPMAMSAPTPISSLVHSSTLVTAGLYFLIKLNFLMPNNFKMMMLIMSVVTFALSGLFSFLLIDLKKAVALSTLSQLGMIFFSMMSGLYMISFTHLIIHALFKSSLFVNLGYFMNYSISLQDMSIMSKENSNKLMKINFLISCLSLMGFMFTSGFMSKDFILVNFSNSLMFYLIFMVMILGCVMTGCYSIKLIMFLKMSFMNYTQEYFYNDKSMYSLVMFMSVLIMMAPLYMFDLLYIDFMIISFFSVKMIFYSILAVSLIMVLFMKNYLTVYIYLSSFFFSYMLSYMYIKVNNLMNFIKLVSFKMIHMEEKFQTFFFNGTLNLLNMSNFLKLFYLMILLYFTLM